MGSVGVAEAAQRRIKQCAAIGAPRLVALLGGTTTLADCLTALGYLVDPRRAARGPSILEYERAFAHEIGVRYAYSFWAGRVGLYGLLRALGVGSGDEVLLQVPTHVVVANAIRYAAARPVYVDCRLDSYNMDLEQAERQITPRTRALVLQHTFGIPADIDAVLDLARRHRLALIEDCVHALGAGYDGRPLGSFGQAAFFSTEETKTISSTMGGMVVTDDPALAARLQRFQAGCAWPSARLTAGYLLKLILYHLLTQPGVHPYPRALYNLVGRRHPLPKATSGEELRGGRPANYLLRLSNAQAALALRQLRRLKANVAHRRLVAEAYRRRLTERGFETPRPPAKAEPAFVRYPVWVPDKRAALEAAAPHAMLGTWFDSVLEEAASPARLDYRVGSCPQAEAATRHLVNLPTHPRVGQADVEAIVAALAKAASAARSG
ncbi:MAG TPA: aminotransferase class I/II-fold pyridoxal phosphate-dependent enzyme [Chloroflexota bacterium]